VKWVGLFAVALVGLYTLEDLWDLFGDVQMPKMVYATHWIARAACLILIPAAVYIASFVAHFKVLNQSGPGDGTMGSLFQASLNGSTFKDNPFGKFFLFLVIFFSIR
jgi:dolichyl-phosphate-mannose-protein mannosyltransferase